MVSWRFPGGQEEILIVEYGIASTIMYISDFFIW